MTGKKKSIFHKIKNKALAQQRVEQLVEETRDLRLVHDVPSQKTVIKIDQQMIFSLRTHKTLQPPVGRVQTCLLYTSDAADDNRLV